jgi:type I restriction enzyme M protein
MEACVLICNNRKSEKLREKIIFINAVKEVTRKNAESYLEPKHIEKILNAYHSEGDIDSFKREVKWLEIEKNNYDLSIQKYVFISESIVSVTSIDETLSEWDKSNESALKAYAELQDLL